MATAEPLMASVVIYEFGSANTLEKYTDHSYFGVYICPNGFYSTTKAAPKLRCPEFWQAVYDLDRE